ncbi:MAG: DUF421 domain-containing protein [Clostridia bacterium]|nr:DUF421 domain-containing protein [Clostridia bacterium]
MRCDFIEVTIWSVVSLAVLFLMSKLMGNKQISQLNGFDYIVGISIGSIAAELASVQDVDKPLNNVLAILIYGVVAYAISVITAKSIAVRKIITGRPIVIMDNGEIFRKNLAKARIDMNEFLTLCREKGYFDISTIQTAFIEHDGKLSILPKSENRPVTPSDMQLSTENETVQTVVISDGHILRENLHITGHDSVWLLGELKKQNLEVQNVFIAFCSDSGKVSAYRMNKGNCEVDKFE